MSRPREDQVTGALFGCAVGDALGAPLEGRSRERIAGEVGIADRYRPFPKRPGASNETYPLGQYTDDTQLTLAIVRALLKRGRVDGAAIAAEFAALWESGEIIGAGPVAHRAVKRLLAGIHWEAAAVADDLPLNGAAMRIAPIGLWDCGEPQDLPHDVAVASVVTHRHPLAIDAALAIATAVAQAVAPTVIDMPRFLAAVAQPVENRSPALARNVRRLERWLQLPEDDALESIASTDGSRMRNGFGIPALAMPTALAALYAFLRNPRDFVATVDTSLRIGGDADTIAAIAGAVSGAHNGLGAIPTHLVDGVKDSAKILDLGRRLFALRFGR